MIDPTELHAFADGELSREETAAVHSFLEVSPESRAELQRIHDLKALLRDRVEPTECAVAWKACVGRLDELDRTRKIEKFVGRYAWGLCGAFFAFIVIGGSMNRAAGPQMHSADIARMVSTLVPTRVPQTRDQGQMHQWLDDLLGQASRSIDPNRMEIRSAATGVLDGRPVTRLTLRDPNGDLALLVVPDVMGLNGMETFQKDPSFRLGQVQGINCIAWSDGRNTLMLMANRSHEDLAATASRLSIH